MLNLIPGVDNKIAYKPSHYTHVEINEDFEHEEYKFLNFL